MPQSPALPQGVQFQVEFACELTKVRQSAATVQSFLQEQGCSSADVVACQLALVEACNNAVKYATPEGRAKPVTVTVVCGKSEVAITVADHTAGFDLPAEPIFPAHTAEQGRGVPLMLSLMDEVAYFRGIGQNMLLLRKRRSGNQEEPARHF
jgi:anti-sigma regulatory factor (Ser/Thr protein kinase)